MHRPPIATATNWGQRSPNKKDERDGWAEGAEASCPIGRTRQGVAVVEHIEANAYHAIMQTYYPASQANELALRNRLTASDIFREVGTYYESRLKVDPHLIAIATRLGVSP